jgi:hypothetical protein
LRGFFRGWLLCSSGHKQKNVCEQKQQLNVEVATTR